MDCRMAKGRSAADQRPGPALPPNAECMVSSGIGLVREEEEIAVDREEEVEITRSMGPARLQYHPCARAPPT